MSDKPISGKYMSDKPISEKPMSYKSTSDKPMSDKPVSKIHLWQSLTQYFTSYKATSDNKYQTHEWSILNNITKLILLIIEWKWCLLPCDAWVSHH